MAPPRNLFTTAAATVLGLGTTMTMMMTTPVQAACNGEDALCDRLYSNVTFVGSHDSAFVGELLADNQLVSVADQLSLGVRFLQAQTHDKDGTIEMCHTSCLELDAGSLAEYLAPVKTFMDANPDEVLTLLLTNGDDIAVADYASVFSSVGLDEYVFTPSGTLALADWPTLQTLIDDGTRLVVWMGMSLPHSAFLQSLARPKPHPFRDEKPPEAGGIHPGKSSPNLLIYTKKITMPTPLRCRTSWTNSHITLRQATR